MHSRRLTDMGRRNGSDIVLGKVASDFRGVALGLYRVDRDVCTIHDSQIISSLTPHKMFRRSFLAEHGIRFPEGRRRLEDQLFVVQAYFAARVISIVADEICYFYVGRDDGGNAGSNRTWDPTGYYTNLREVLDVVVANTEPGPNRDRLMGRFFRAQLVGRLAGGRFLTWTPEFRDEVYNNIRGVLIDYVDPPGRRQPGRSDGPPRGVRSEPIFCDDLLTLAQRTSDIVAPPHVESIRWVAGRLEVALTTEFQHRDGTPFVFVRGEGRTALDPRMGRDLVAAPVDVTEEIGAVRLMTMLRDRSSGVEWATTTDFRLEWSEAGSTPEGESASRLRFRARCRVDPAFIAGGGRLPVGDWIWKARLNAFGFNIEGPVGAGTPDVATPPMPPPQFLPPDLLVAPHFVAGAGLTLEVARVDGPPRGQAVYRRPVWSSLRMRARAGRTARAIHGRLPPALQLRSAALVLRLRSRTRSKR